MDNTLIPTEWIICKISDIATVNPKKIEADPEATSGFIPMSHAPTDYAGKLEFDKKPWGEIKKSYTNFQNGDVIFAKVTPCFENGKAAVVEGLPNGIGAGSSEFYVLRADAPYFSERLLYALIKTHGFATEGAQNMTGAVGLRRVPRKFVEEYPVSLPPLAEQKVIAEKLDKLLAKVDSIKARLDAVPDTLKRFRQSVLAAAVSGKLTEEWRIKNGLIKDSWELKKVEEQCEKVVVGFVGSIKAHISDKTEVPLLSTTHVQQEGFTWKEKRFVTKSFSESTPKSLVKPGDILVARHGDSGRCCIVPSDYPEYQTSNVVVIKTNNKGNAKYITLAMNALKDAIKEHQVGGVMKVVNTKSVAAHEIPTPSMVEQTEIVRRVEKLFAYADKVEAEVNAAQERVNKLTQSILAKAFRGELTAKWREQNPELISGENSAEALLEKIKTEREKLKPIKKRKAK